MEWFGEAQAAISNRVAQDLDAVFADESPDAWPEVFKELSKYFIDWRYDLALKNGTASSGTAAPKAAAAFLVPITDTSPNVDPMGADVGFWSKGNKWREDLRAIWRRHRNPSQPPGCRVGEWINERMDAEGDLDNELGGVLQNRVTLPNGEEVNGNRLLRRDGADDQNVVGVLRAKASGVKTNWIRVNGDIVYTQTGIEADRKAIREGLYVHLAELETGHQKGEAVTVEEWANIAYLLYQSPETKKGSDAINRVYLMTLASRWMDQLPVMPQDIDLQAYARNQQQFIEEVVAAQNQQPSH